MRLRLQLAGCLLAVGLSAALCAPTMAQRGRVAHFTPPQHAAAPKAQTRPPQKPPRQQEKNTAKPPKNSGNGGARNGQGNGGNRPDSASRPNANPNGDPNRPPSSYVPPAPQKKFSDLSP